MAKQNSRISGIRLKEKTDYTIEANGAWDVDIQNIAERINTYLKDAADAGKYSIAGLCIALGITRERLNLWREGYFRIEDIGCAVPNPRLAACAQMGLLHLQRYWEESERPSSLCLKQLEITGALGDDCRPRAMPPFDLGSIKKYAR
ncbi:MAG: hypothetical protein WDA65_08975 [Christensenellales bacterium]